MQINFTGDNIEITDALRQLVEKKFHHIENNYNHKITSASVVLATENLTHAAEITIFTPGKEIVAHGKADDMYKAIDQMITKAHRQLMKYKEKLTNHKNHKE
ncbi:MAG: ribosome-associated translation inhibitor RaiA [Pseudomonadota bacterium]